MALTKPILNTVTSWDVTDGYNFTFNVVGGDQVIGNTLTIRNNSTNAVVYTNTVTSFALSNTVPANATGLTNGTYYNAYITTRNSSGDTSVSSNIIQFYCYSTPELTFTNVVDGGSVDNSSFNATIRYDQDENEKIASYVINLYSADQTLINTSGLVYTSNVTSLPATFSYLFTGLLDSTVYYVRATCSTVHGATADTGYIQFTCLYETLDVYSAFTLVNNCTEGYVTISSSAILIDGIYSGEGEPTYVDDEAVDLQGDGLSVTWNDGYKIYNDFTAKVWLTNPNLGYAVLKFKNENNDEIVVRMVKNYDTGTGVFAELTVTNGYVAYTSTIAEATSTQQYCIQIRRVDNLYDIVLGVVTA